MLRTAVIPQRDGACLLTKGCISVHQMLEVGTGNADAVDILLQSCRARYLIADPVELITSLLPWQCPADKLETQTPILKIYTCFPAQEVVGILRISFA